MATTLTLENREYVPKAWETVACPICGARESRPHEKFGPSERYEYVQCNACDLVYLNPRPRYDEEFLATAYDQYGAEGHHVLNGGALDAGERATVEQYKVVLRQMERVLGRKPLKILDIGCATGLFLLAAREQGHQGVGIDISGPMVEFMKKTFGFPGFAGQYHELDLSGHAPFDVIYCSHVIEHIPNPIDWMEKFRRDLRSDGIVCLNIPNQYSIDRVVKRLLKRLGLRKDRWEVWRTPDHLYEPHMRPLRELFSRTGFEVIEHFTYSRHERVTPGPGQWLFHNGLKVGSKLRVFLRPARS